MVSIILQIITAAVILFFFYIYFFFYVSHFIYIFTILTDNQLCKDTDKQENQTEKVLKQQLQIIKKVELNEFMIAYEPIWAIGSGETANIDYIDKVHRGIIDEVSSYQKEGFMGVSYGGSVDSTSSKDILSIKGVKGLLIGGASLQYQEFCNIVLSNH